MKKDKDNEDLNEFEFDFSDESSDSSKKSDVEDFNFDEKEEKEDAKASSNEDFDFDFDEEDEENESKELKDTTVDSSVEDDFDFDEEEDENTVINSELEEEDDFDFEEEDTPLNNSNEEDFNFEEEEEDTPLNNSNEEDFNFEEEEEDTPLNNSNEEDFDFEEKIDENESDLVKEQVEDFDFDTNEEEEEFDFEEEIIEKTTTVSQHKKEIKDTGSLNSVSEDDFLFEEDDFDLRKKKQEKLEAAEKEKNKQALLKEEMKLKDSEFDIDDIFSEEDEEITDSSNEQFVNDFISKDYKEDYKEDFLEADSSSSNKISMSEVIKGDKPEATVPLETVLQKNNKNSKSSSNFNFNKVIISMLAIGALSIGTLFVYENKDDIMNTYNDFSLSNESAEQKAIALNEKQKEVAEKVFDEKSEALRKRFEDYDNTISSLKLSDISSKNTIKTLEKKLKDQEFILLTIQNNDNSDSKIITEFKSAINDFSIKVNDIEGEQGETKILLQQTVQAALNLISENKMLDKNLETKIYNNVYNEFKKVFDNQRFRLNDLSIIENKLNEVLNINKNILSDQSKTNLENSKLKEQQKEFNNQLKKLTLELEAYKTVANNAVSSQSNQQSNNVINLLKNNTQPNNAIVIDKKSNFSIPEYKIEGIIDNRLAYIKVEGEGNRAKPYTVGDTLEGYGKILKMESSAIIAEQGTLRRTRN